MPFVSWTPATFSCSTLSGMTKEITFNKHAPFPQWMTYIHPSHLHRSQAMRALGAIYSSSTRLGMARPNRALQAPFRVFMDPHVLPIDDCSLSTHPTTTRCPPVGVFTGVPYFCSEIKKTHLQCFCIRLLALFRTWMDPHNLPMGDSIFFWFSTTTICITVDAFTVLCT